MAHLINCFECGAKISSEAWECPKCNAPKGGHKCEICRKAEKKILLDEYSYKADGEENTLTKLVHPECLAIVRKEYSDNNKAFTYTCRLCGYHFDSFPVKIYPAAVCDECGHRIPDDDMVFLHRSYPSRTYYCRKCGLPLIPIGSKLIKHEDKSMLLHKICYENEKKKYDKINTKEEKGCFLATALYGEDSSKVRMLCFFRDEYLSANSLGRAFIALYVRLSPPLARAIAKESLLRTLVRYCIVSPALLFTEKFLAYAGRKDKAKR